jgi:N-acetylmuramoyl-L-alanine amidase
MIAADAPPPIVQNPIPFGEKRKREMRAYARRHYGLNTALLKAPKVIVEHVTVTSSFRATFNVFAPDVPDVELHELPGVCSHFVVDRGGKIHQLVPLRLMCRHTVGLNYTAIGIEHVGTSDAEILGNPRQIEASLRLTVWLMQRFNIALGNVVGHNESLTSRYHLERYPAWRCQTHGDWVKADMDIYRARLAQLARRYGVELGPAVKPVRSSC